MPLIDKLKEELAILREEYRNLFIFFLATITGTITSFYQALTHQVEFYIVILSALGFCVSLFVLLLLKKVREKIDKNIEELGDIQ
jgi:hypothetical protein